MKGPLIHSPCVFLISSSVIEALAQTNDGFLF